MKHDQDMDGLEPLTREALDWVVRLTSGAATQADARAFTTWRDQSPAHATAVRDATAFRQTLRAMALPHPASNVVPLRRPRLAGLDRRAFFMGGGAIAASVAAVAVVRPPLGLWPSLAEFSAEHRTGPSQRESLAPTAGVRVEMNGRSAVSLRDGGHGMELVAGEAFVAVDKPAREFVVAVGDRRFASQAAQVNIRTSKRETCVTCLAGVVRRIDGDARQVVRAGQQLILLPEGGSRLVGFDPLRVTGWRKGLLIFQDTPLAEALEDINRYRKGRIILADAALGARPVNGVFHISQIDNAVTQVPQLLGLSVTRLPGDVILLG